MPWHQGGRVGGQAGFSMRGKDLRFGGMAVRTLPLTLDF
jgi:hypothetical protein